VSRSRPDEWNIDGDSGEDEVLVTSAWRVEVGRKYATREAANSVMEKNKINRAMRIFVLPKTVPTILCALSLSPCNPHRYLKGVDPRLDPYHNTTHVRVSH
jgi:hypothetical protein